MFVFKNLNFICMAKDSHILLTKNNCVFVIFMFEVLKNHYLTMLLILNNWALITSMPVHDRYSIDKLMDIMKHPLSS